MCRDNGITWKSSLSFCVAAKLFIDDNGMADVLVGGDILPSLSEQFIANANAPQEREHPSRRLGLLFVNDWGRVLLLSVAAGGPKCIKDDAVAGTTAEVAIQRDDENTT